MFYNDSDSPFDISTECTSETSYQTSSENMISSEDTSQSECSDEKQSWKTTLEEINISPVFQKTTALFLAINDNDEETVDILLRVNNVNPDILSSNRCGDYCSPLQLSVDKRNYNIVKLLLKYKANPNLGKREFYMIETPLTKATKNQDHGVMKLLLDAGANSDHASFRSIGSFKIIETALHYAVKTSDYESVKILLDSTTNDIDHNSIYSTRFSQINNGPTELYYAVGSGNKYILELLMQRNANPYAKVFDCFREIETTPMRRAELNDDDDVINILIRQ